MFHKYMIRKAMFLNFVKKLPFNCKQWPHVLCRIQKQNNLFLLPFKYLCYDVIYPSVFSLQGPQKSIYRNHLHIYTDI